MKFFSKPIFYVIFFTQLAFIGQHSASVVEKKSSKSLDKKGSDVSLKGIIFKGMTENGVSRNTFLCGNTEVHGSGKSGGVNFEADDCTVNAIQAACGMDISGGKTVQFFNNFTYWLKQKTQKEQLYKTSQNLDDADLENKMKSEGWGCMGAYCVLITTNPILQETVAPDKVAGADEVKVIVQLWYNGGHLIQLWSQDVALLKSGQGFVIAITNSADSALKQSLSKTINGDSYLAAASIAMQPDNRIEDDYNSASNSPRFIKIIVS